MNFYIGQRVKMVNSSFGIPDTEGIITGLETMIYYYHDISTILCYEVTDFEGRGWNCPAAHIRPILPEGWKKTHWDQCLWQPEGEEEFEFAYTLVKQQQRA